MNSLAQRLRFRPTGFGVLLAGVCAAAGLSAPRSADPQIAGLAWVVLGAIVLVGALWPVLAIAAIRFSVLQCDSDAVVGGEVGLELAIRGWSSSLEVRLAGAPDSAWHRVGAPGAGRLACPAISRGRYEQLMIEVSSAAPLGIVRARRRVALRLPAPLYIAPEPLSAEWDPTLVDSGSVDGTSPRASLTGDVVRAVRPYTPGDPSHLVHWASSARAGALMIRELEPPAQIGVAVVVDLGDDAPRAEMVASHAAGVVDAVIDSGGRLVLATCDAAGPRTDVVTTRLQALRLLAAATAGAPGGAPADWPVVMVHS